MDMRIEPSPASCMEYPDARLCRIGLLRLQLMLPRFRETIRNGRFVDLAIAYALAVLFLEHLRGLPVADLDLLDDYESPWREILADVEAECVLLEGRIRQA